MSNDNKFLSQALIELSDAIEQLALALAQQNNEDNQTGIKKIAVITKKFRKIEKALQTDETEKPDLKTLIKQKHKKNWLQNYLSDRGIYIGRHVNNLLVDNKLFETAEYFADHYLNLEEFYQKLKRHQHLKKDFIMPTHKASIKYIRQWSEMLHKNKIIDAFAFADTYVDIDINQINEATYFINGYWLEILLRGEIARFFRHNISVIDSFDILAQVEIQRPDKKTSELDLLLMVNQKVYWFECKSGHIGSVYYNRFNKHRNLLNLNSRQAFLLVPEMNLNQAEYVFKETGMSLIYSTDIENQLKQIIQFNK